MKKKFSVFRILLIVLGALMIVGFFAMPFATLDKNLLIDEINRTYGTHIDSLSMHDAYEALSDEEKEEQLENALEALQKENPDATKEDAQDFIDDYFSIKIPSFYSSFNIMRFVMKVNGLMKRASSFAGVDLGDLGGGAVLLYLILLVPVIFGLAIILLAIFTRKPAYIIGIIAGVLLLILYGLESIVVIAGSTAFDGADLPSYFSFNPAYAVLLILPIALIVISIIGLVKDKGEVFDPGYGDQPYGPGDGYDQNDGYGYGMDGYDPYGNTGSYQDPYRGNGYGAGMGGGQGALVGIKGEYLGATIPVGDGENITIGRNPAASQVVIDNAAVSRVHCHVTYFADQNTYGVTDVSKFGVYDGTGSRLSQGQMTYLQPGDEIHIGRSHNVFRLQ